MFCDLLRFLRLTPICAIRPETRNRETRPAAPCLEITEIDRRATLAAIVRRFHDRARSTIKPARRRRLAAAAARDASDVAIEKARSMLDSARAPRARARGSADVFSLVDSSPIPRHRPCDALRNLIDLSSLKKSPRPAVARYIRSSRCGTLAFIHVPSLRTAAA